MEHNNKKNINIKPIKAIYPFNSNYLKINNYNYHYLDEGDENAPPIVMVHGNPTWSFMFRNLVHEFSSEYRMIAPDHLGCGLSDKPEKFDHCLESHIDNLETLMFGLNLKNITLIVHDWGGAIGMGFAVRHPQMIAKIIILNSAAYSQEFMPFRIKLCRIPWLDSILVKKFNLFVRAATVMTTVKALSQEVKTGYMLPYSEQSARNAVLRFIQDIPTNTEHITFERLLEIEHGLWMFREKPVGIIWGMHDWCFDHRFLERWKLFYPQAQVLELPHAGHLVLEDAHSEASEFIRKFMQNNN